MAKLAFSDLPWVVRGAVALSGLTAWVVFEDQIIERQGLDRWLPFYRVGALCVYDVVFVALLAWAFLSLNRQRP